MKNKQLIQFLLLIMLNSALIAQAPYSFTYQTVLRDEAGQAITNENVMIRFTILMGSPDGAVVFSETHEAQTNEFGLISLAVGQNGSLEAIQWNNNTYFLEVSVNNQVIGTSQLLSVPFALSTITSADAFSGNYHDLENLPDLMVYPHLADPQNGEMIFFGENEWERITPVVSGQLLTVTNGKPQWSNLPAPPGFVYDIDGNLYKTITVGNQEWMAENLRTTRYRDGTPIIKGSLDDEEWENINAGAYTVYNHDLVDGINSEEEMVNMYGRLYNWYAVNEDRGLCPQGWQIFSPAQWWDFVSICSQHPDVYLMNIGDHIKSCRQVNSPLGGDCNTEEHPRWDFFTQDVYGHDTFGFNAVPSGYRYISEMEYPGFQALGLVATWWTADDGYWDGYALYSGIAYFYSVTFVLSVHQANGKSVRCMRIVE